MQQPERSDVPNKFSLDRGMIPRTVKRMFDQRSENRDDSPSQSATLSARGRTAAVELVNISSSGAMAVYDGALRIGEPVALEWLDRGAVCGHVRWIRNGRVGIHFAASVG